MWYGILLLEAAGIFCYFNFNYHYHFFYQEQNQLFLISSDYLLSYLRKPAWLACMTGDFLTQFYYYLYAGPAILTSLLLTAAICTRKAVRKAGIQKTLVSFLLAVIAMTVLTLFALHYEYRLCSIIAYIGGTIMFISTPPYLRNKEKKDSTPAISSSLTLVGVFLTFWMFGYGVWIYALLVLASTFLRHEKGTAFARFAVVAIPLLLLMLTKKIYFLDYDKLYTYPGIGKFVKPETEVEKFFAVENEYYFGNYKKVISMVESSPSPSNYDLFFYNLVMAQNGQLPEKMLKFNNNYFGTFEKIGPETPLLTTKLLNELYWQMGDMTFAERAAMLANVFSPDNRNIRMMKRLAEINIVSGDKPAAMKYLRILSNTFVYKNWASEIIQSLSKGTTSESMKTYTQKIEFTNNADTIRISDNSHLIMMELLQSNPENRIARDYLLCSDLLLKDMETFKKDYDNFYMKQKSPLYEKVYQEAMMIYLAGTNANEDEWKKYIKRPDIIQRFAAYNQKRGSSEFKDTYWYYFDRGTAPKIGNPSDTDNQDTKSYRN